MSVVAKGRAPFGGAFAGRTVLVTGHTGFKGSWLSMWLTDLGAKVVGYALEPPTDPSAFAAMCLADRVADVRGDVRDAERLNAAFARHRFDNPRVPSRRAVRACPPWRPRAAPQLHLGCVASVRVVKGPFHILRHFQ